MSKLNMVIQSVMWASDSPVTGWDIVKKIKEKTGNRHQQVYRELSKISCREDVNIEFIPQDGKPDKVAYSFKGKGSFVTSGIELSDYRKTDTAYDLLVHDIVYKTNHYDKYIKHMNNAELEFLKNINVN